MQVSNSSILIFTDNFRKLSCMSSSQKLAILFLPMRLALVLCIVLALFLLSPLIIPLGYSQNNSSTLNHSSIQIPGTLSNILELPDVGFSITFPSGWTGINHDYIAMVSPDGINQDNGNFKRDQYKAVMVIEILDISSYNEDNFTSKIQNKCQIESEKFVTFNNIESKEVMIKCGVEGHQKIVNYIFGSRDKIVIVGLKGTGAQFDNNLDAFKDSLNTVGITSPVELRQMPDTS